MLFCLLVKGNQISPPCSEKKFLHARWKDFTVTVMISRGLLRYYDHWRFPRSLAINMHWVLGLVWVTTTIIYRFSCRRECLCFINFYFLCSHRNLFNYSSCIIKKESLLHTYLLHQYPLLCLGVSNQFHNLYMTFNTLHMIFFQHC